MAVCFARRELNDQEANTIASDLFIKPTARNKKYPAGAPVTCYCTDGVDVFVPLMTAQIIKQKRLNIALGHKSIECQFVATLRQEQVSIITEAEDQLTKFGTTTLKVPPGTGKTAIAAYLGCGIKRLMLVVVTRDFFYAQWPNTFTKFTNAKAITVQKELDTIDGVDAVICMDTRLGMLSKVKHLFGTLIIDESHTWCTELRAKALMAFQPAYIIALSANADKANGLYKVMEAFCGSHTVYRKNTKPFQVCKYNTGIVGATIKDNSGNLKWDETVSSVLYNDARNDMIVAIINRHKDRKIGVFTSQVEHALLLKDKLVAIKESVDYMAGDKRTYNDSRVLIGTIPKIGTGFDEATVCVDFEGVAIDMVLIVTSILDDGVLYQVVGRGFRTTKELLVIHLKDVHGVFDKHWRANAKWYKNNCGTVYTE